MAWQSSDGIRQLLSWKVEVSTGGHRAEPQLRKCDPWLGSRDGMEMKVAKLVLDGHLLVTGAITCGDMCQGDWELLLVEAMFSLRQD